MRTVARKICLNLYFLICSHCHADRTVFQCQQDKSKMGWLYLKVVSKSVQQPGDHAGFVEYAGHCLSFFPDRYSDRYHRLYFHA